MNNRFFSYGKKCSFLCKIFSLFLPCNMADMQNLYSINNLQLIIYCTCACSIILILFHNKSSYSEELCSVNLAYKILLHVHVFLTLSSNEHKFSDWSREKQLILFPENFDVSQGKKFMFNSNFDQLSWVEVQCYSLTSEILQCWLI